MMEEEREIHKTNQDDVQDFETQQGQEPSMEETQPKGEVKISEEVISQMAIEALKSVPGVLPASSGLVANLRLGRRTSSGVKITIEETAPNEVIVDTYISVKYGLRIPDIAWDVQEAIKNQIENYTGYTVKAVNVHVQGIHFTESKSQSQDLINP